VEFWAEPEKEGWLQSQGDHLRTWRRRYFVLKDGFLFRFGSADVAPASKPRGVVDLSKARARPVCGAAPVAARGAAPVAAQGAAPVAAQGAAPVAAWGAAPVAAQGAAPVAAQGAAPVAAQGAASAVPPRYAAGHVAVSAQTAPSRLARPAARALV
jgi:hypothetical protein